MAEEKNDRNETEIKENIASEEVEIPDEAEQSGNIFPAKKTGKRLFLILFVLVIAGLAGVPQTREMITDKSRQLLSALKAADQEKTSEAVIESTEIANRLEQLENAREFENAEVVIASVEPAVPSAVSDPAYMALADQQKALLSEIERLRRQLNLVRDNMEQAVKQFNETMPDAQQFDERIAAVHAREDSLEQQILQESLKIVRLEKNKADASAVLSLMTRMDAAEQKLRVSNIERERAVALLLAVYQLREAALSGNGFTMEQQAALALADSFPRIDKSLRSLSAFAGQGVATKTFLMRSFDSYADQAVMSESVSPKTDWFHQALNSLKALIVIRKTNPDENDTSTQAVLARAGIAVKEEDLKEAVLILSELKGKSAAAMQKWVQGAKNHLFVKQTVNEVVSAVLGVVYAEQLKGE